MSKLFAVLCFLSAGFIVGFLALRIVTRASLAQDAARHELDRELIYARRAELENGRILKQLDSMREQRDEMMREIGKLPAPPEDFGDGPYERVDWTLKLLEQKDRYLAETAPQRSRDKR